MRSIRPWTKLGAASVVAVVVAALPGPVGAEQPIQVFILAGQSNMIGRGEPISAGTGPVPNLFQWRDGAWQPAADPLGSDHDAAIGPGMTFGIGVLSHEPPGTKVGLIMCARGETGIGNWIPGAGVYKRCKKEVRAAGGHVAGIVILQGEHEAATANGAGRWDTTFPQSLDGFEQDFGPAPFVLGQIGNLDLSRSPYAQEVRDAQAASAVGHPEIALVPSVDLPMESVHYTVDGYKTLGRRFADGWWSLWQQLPSFDAVSPGSGRAGDSIRITGSGFGIATSVRFGSADATYQVDSDTQITATVPNSALTNGIRVATPLGIATDTTPFAVLPTVGSFTPTSGQVGKAVRLSGLAFKGTTQVTFNGVPAKFKVSAPTTLKLWVPSHATSGVISVTNAGGTSSSAAPFIVLPG